jgi:hypothetical protein
LALRGMFLQSCTAQTGADATIAATNASTAATTAAAT